VCQEDENVSFILPSIRAIYSEPPIHLMISGIMKSKILLILLFLLSANTIASGQMGSNDSLMIKSNGNDIHHIKILIAYQSKYGSTKQYAEWIHRESDGDLVN
jgi:hypothetical protein